MANKHAVNEKGERIYKKIVIRVFTPEKKTSSFLHYSPPPGYGVTDEAIAEALQQVLQQCNKEWPEYEYSVVPLPKQHYNFVCTGLRKKCQTN